MSTCQQLGRGLVALRILSLHVPDAAVRAAITRRIAQVEVERGRAGCPLAAARRLAGGGEDDRQADPGQG